MESLERSERLQFILSSEGVYYVWPANISEFDSAPFLRKQKFLPSGRCKCYCR